jgi:hypothetical protein
MQDGFSTACATQGNLQERVKKREEWNRIYAKIILRVFLHFEQFNLWTLFVCKNALWVVKSSGKNHFTHQR